LKIANFKEQRSRNIHIYELYHENHMTMAAIGRRVGLSRERVRQIVRQYEGIFGVYEKALTFLEEEDAEKTLEAEKSRKPLNDV